MNYIRLIFVVLISFAQLTLFSQTNSKKCDLKNLDKQFKKSDSKIKKADFALEIADCLRLSNDTLSTKWYKTVIETHKEDRVYDGENRWESKPALQIGLSYYWLKDYLRAEVWLTKAIESKDKNTYQFATYKYNTDQALYYCGKSYYINEDFKNAKYYLTQYKKIKGDTLDVTQLIQNCN